MDVTRTGDNFESSGSSSVDRNVDRLSARRRSSTKGHRFLRAIHHVIFNASREGRIAEVAAWSNAAAALALGGLAFYGLHSWVAGLVVALFSFILLRVALAHRVTVWIAASFGTLAVGAAGGTLAWVFAHVVEIQALPAIAAIFGAIFAACPPAWSYARLARHRQDDIRDSLVDPVSVPPSG